MVLAVVMYCHQSSFSLFSCTGATDYCRLGVCVNYYDYYHPRLDDATEDDVDDSGDGGGETAGDFVHRLFPPWEEFRHDHLNDLY